jgi:hypothetical protein
MLMILKVKMLRCFKNGHSRDCQQLILLTGSVFKFISKQTSTIDICSSLMSGAQRVTSVAKIEASKVQGTKSVPQMIELVTKRIRLVAR